MLVLNLKMNLSKSNILDYERFIHDKKVIVLPQYPYLLFFSRGNYDLGSQDVSKYSKGSYTGEVCAKGLKQLGVKYVLVGHFERRKYFNETLDDLKAKMQNALENDLIPIYCVTQSLEDKNNDPELKQIEYELDAIPNYLKYIVVAFEPDWLIGETNQEVDTIYIDKVLKKIKEYLMERNINHTIIYGGGVNSNNIDELQKLTCNEGYIISSSALNLDELDIIYNKIN